MANLGWHTQASPDPHAVLRRQPELVALFDAECVVELREVAKDAVAAELRRRVRIGRQHAGHGGIAVFAAPHLGPADEEPLWTSQTVQGWGVFALQRKHVRLVSDRHAAEIADVFAD